MSTGTDEHGMKIQRAAEKEGVAPREDAVELHKSIIFFFSYQCIKNIHRKSKGVIANHN